MTIYSIRHVTTYRYKAPVAFGEHRLLLRPRDGFDQRTLAATLDIEPRESRVSWSEDASGNLVGTARMARRARELVFTSVVQVEQTSSYSSDLRLAEHARSCPFSYGAEEFPDLARFIERQHPDPGHAVGGWARRILEEDPGRDTLAFVLRLNATIRRDFAYLRREEEGVQRPSVTLRLGRGSCRDFAVLMIDALRALGLAARFVSGYLHFDPAAEPRNVALGSMHAWLQVYLPGAGWIDCDPTSGAIGNRGLIRTAIVRDPHQATPLSGTFIGFPSEYTGMEVSVSVTRTDGLETASRTRIERRAS